MSLDVPGQVCIIGMVRGCRREREWLPVSATGKKGEVTGILIYRLAEGIIMELWEECDYLGFFQQLGLSGLPQ